jgi:hypothetical protein
MTLVSKQYWATLRGPEFVKEVRQKVKRHFDVADHLGLCMRWRDQYANYYMRKGKNGFGDSTQLDTGTRKKPEINIHVPEMRSLIRQQLAFLLAEPISFQVVSRTGGQRSVMASEIGEKACNYIYDEHIKPTQVELAEHLIVYGAAASHLRWDAKRGDDVLETIQVPLTYPEGHPQAGQEIPEQSKDDNGEPRFNADGTPVPLTDEQGVVIPKLIEQKQKAKSGAPYRDALDPTMFAQDPIIGTRANWVVAFERTNLYVLAAKFAQHQGPDGQVVDLSQQILGQHTHDEYEAYRLNLWQDEYGADEGDILIMHFYYADSTEIPGGRHVIIIGDMDIDLGPCPLPAGRLPVRILLNSKYTDNAMSFADALGIGPIEDALNRIRSAELANYAYYGKQTRYREEGQRVVPGEQASGGTREIVGPRGAPPPVMLQVMPMPPGAQALKEDLIESLPRISGFGDVSRGTIEDTTSGAHAAVFEAITARNLSLPQAQLVTHETEVANDTIDMLQNFGNVEFIIEIAGKSGAPLAKAFEPEAFGTIRRLVAKAVPDAMRGSLARIKLIELTKDIEDPRERAKAVQMITRGDDEYGKNDSRCINLIAIENEWLLSGEEPVVASTYDNHYDHFVDHKAAFDEYRTTPGADPEVLMRFQMHMQEHTEHLQNQDPVAARLAGYPEPPILPGNNAFIFAMRLQEAQMQIAPPPPPEEGGGDSKPPSGGKKEKAAA